MRERAMRYWLDKAISALCRLVMSVFFRDVEVVGAERIPTDAPLLLVGNHQNALIDPVLLVGFLPLRPRLLAKSTLWRNPFLAPLLALGGAIPVFRRQDVDFADESDQHMARNEQMFARCHELLAAGGAIALFPEGASHNEPKLMPLKTGVARIALEAEIKYPGLGVRIVPVGLIFDARSRFRSRALVQVGEPIDPSGELEQYRDEPREAVSELTARVAAGLAAVTPNYSTWEEARLAHRAAEIIAHDPVRGRRDELPLSKHAALSRAVFEGYEVMKDREPLHVAAVYDLVKSYDRLLRVFKLRTGQITTPYGSAGAAWFAAHTLGVLLVRLPLTLLGIVLNFVPYQIVGSLAVRMPGTRDVKATYKVFAGFFLFPLTWILEAAAAVWLYGSHAGWLVLVLGPTTAWIAMRSADRRRNFLTEARAFFILRSNRQIAIELGRRREEIVSEIEALASRLAEDAELPAFEARAR